MGNNKGKWDEFYSDLKDPDHYIDTATYEMGADFLKDCNEVEDWGCGKGWFATVALKLNVVGVDGSNTPFADKIVDLEDYTTSVEGIFMRHVAEHNFEWEKVLENLTDSFTKRACVIFYTPMNNKSDEALVVTMSPGWDNIPELSIPTSVWERMLDKKNIKYEIKVVDSTSFYGVETVYYLYK